MDVEWLPERFNFPLVDDPGGVASGFTRTLLRVTASFRVFQQPWVVVADAAADTPFDRWKNLDHTAVVLSRESSAQRNLEQHLRDDARGRVFIFLDKDGNRRALESATGAAFRLFEILFRDPKHYRHRRGLDAEKVARIKQLNAEKLIPNEWLKGVRFRPEDVPVARRTRKSKRMAKESKGLACEKMHSHDRKIINCAAEPLKTKLRLHARALRLVQKIAGRKTWTLWNHSKIADEVVRAFDSMEVAPGFGSRCPCGKEKPHRTSVCKVDAAQFFKAVNPQRAFRRCQTLLHGILAPKRFDALAMHKHIRGDAHLAKYADKGRKREYHVLRLVDILAAMDYALQDRYFTVGHVVIEKKGPPDGKLGQ